MKSSTYSGKIKIFLDGADRSSMAELARDPEVHGFTTNPSLMKKSGVTDYPGFCQEILPLLGGKPVSFEVFADDLPEMKAQALKIASWEVQGRDQLYVKIPIINTRGESTLSLVRELTQKKVKLNITALYTIEQIWGTTQALQGGAPSLVSVFAGRLADTGRDPLPLMKVAADLCDTAGNQCELLWASTREAYNIVQAEEAGCKVITAPLDILKKLKSFNRSPLDLTFDTVKAFKADSDAAGFKL